MGLRVGEKVGSPGITGGGVGRGVVGFCVRRTEGSLLGFFDGDIDGL